MPSTRQGILSATLLHSGKWWYLSDLARHLHVRPSSLQRELATLARAGVLERRREGNRVYFRPDANCPFLTELTSLIVKTTGVVDVLRRALAPLRKRIDLAFVYGSLARGDVHSASDVDLMLVGQLGLAELAKPLKAAENRLGRAVNPTIYPQKELVQKLRAGHHFIATILKEPKLFVIGRQDDLEAITGQRQGSTPRHREKRT
jgi:DNA-binding transcriptional ArsR family regulator